MSEPDLTPEDAATLAGKVTLRDLPVALGFAFGFLMVVGYASIAIEHWWHIPRMSTALVAFALSHATLVVRKPRLFWNGGSAIRARLRMSAKLITRWSLVVDSAVIIYAVVRAAW